MAPRKVGIIGPESLAQAIKSVFRLTKCSEIVVIGSQALLVGRDDIQRDLRFSREIDLYPRSGGNGPTITSETSEEINALFGEGSAFDQTFGFFIDGTDENTASLSPTWNERAVRKSFEVDGQKVTAIAPEPNDLVASKLVRGEPKDLKFTTGCFKSGLVKFDIVGLRLCEILNGDDLKLAQSRLRRARHPKPFNPDLGNSGFEF